ncbi:MAG: HAD family hydrolase [Chloroflexaceae bacterium]
MHKLILWDVDGTLVHTGGIAGETMRKAMTQVFGPLSRRERAFYSGKTDRQIIQETFPDLTPTAVFEQLQTFITVYVEAFAQRQSDVISSGGALPGTTALLAHLQAHAIQAPLTGNVAPIARLKLDWLGLLPFMHLEVGAYGDDHHERGQLVPIAAERAAEHYGRPFTGQDIIVVGDTPHDIRCGKLNGTRTVAVATGPYTCEELAAHQPDATLPDLNDLDAALAAILT